MFEDLKEEADLARGRTVTPRHQPQNSINTAEAEKSEDLDGIEESELEVEEFDDDDDEFDDDED